VYSKLFDYIVFRLNNVLFRGRVGRSIGILDIFGFEVFPKNLFEQLCINYCNERLQYFFNEVMFQSELEVYRQEGIECEGIAFQDNLGCVRLIDSRNPLGIFSMLDEEGVMPRSSDAKFIARVHSHFDENKITKSAYYARNRRRPDEFSIRHFAGEVTYCSDGFIEKNKDSMSGNIVSELEAGSIEFLRDSFAHGSSGTAPPSSSSSSPPKATAAHADSAAAKMTLSAKFKADLDSLMATLKTTAPHFIRCIKPNDKQVPDAFDPMLTLRQMKYAGM
jgi:myosin-5